MSEDWNLQTNLKPKPNAQGTLFSGGRSQMNPAKRYPRGYTPDRMRAVQAVTMVEGAQLSENVGPYMTTRHDVLENLARSSAPVEDMKKFHLQVSGFADSKQMHEDGINGDYKRGGGGWGRARVALDRIHMPTVIHELGHHASHTQGTEHSEYALPSQRGREEGFADAYADKHFVEHPRAEKMLLEDGRRGLQNYEPTERQARTRHAEEHFASGYNAMRPMGTRVPNAYERVTGSLATRAAEETRVERNTPTLPGMEKR